jgi:hypothetical protein
MMFKPNRLFRSDYNRLFRKDPEAANTLLLLAELADDKGQVKLGPCPEVEIQQLLVARFEDKKAYQLLGGPKK